MNGSSAAEAMDPGRRLGHYEIQARLYALALVKALRARSEAEYQGRFGGMIYVFVRGLRGRGAEAGMGIYFARPSWAEVLEYEQDLIRLGAQPRGGSR